MLEVIEALEGSIAVLESLEEGSHDPRHYTLMAALEYAISVLDGIEEQGMNLS